MSAEPWAVLVSHLLSLSVDVLREVEVGWLIRCSSLASESSTVITVIAPGGFVAGVEMVGRARPYVCGVWREPKASVSEDGSLRGTSLLCWPKQPNRRPCELMKLAVVGGVARRKYCRRYL